MDRAAPDPQLVGPHRADYLLTGRYIIERRALYVNGRRAVFGFDVVAGRKCEPTFRTKCAKWTWWRDMTYQKEKQRCRRAGSSRSSRVDPASSASRVTPVMGGRQVTGRPGVSGVRQRPGDAA